jgi:hypothetical protein
MTFAKLAAAGVCLALLVASARADDPDTTAHNLAAQCAAKNGTFDTDKLECTEPSEGSAAGDLVVGPMMKVLGPEAQGADGAASGQ